jgi:hypothetical protein
LELTSEYRRETLDVSSLLAKCEVWVRIVALEERADERNREIAGLAGRSSRSETKPGSLVGDLTVPLLRPSFDGVPDEPLLSKP